MASAAAEALGKIRDPHAIESLISVLSGPYEIRNTASGALAEITGQDNKAAHKWQVWWEQNKEFMDELNDLSNRYSVK